RRRSVLGALDYAANTFQYEITDKSVTRTTVVKFLEQVAEQGDDRLTFIVLDNARMHHGIDQKTLEHWLMQHYMILVYLPAYSPELNLIEILWKQAKYYRRRFITWSKETLEAEIAALLDGYGNLFEISFS
ncbi:transposase, partial [Photobacterium sagamiensis]